MPKKVIIVDDDVRVLPVKHFVKLTTDPGLRPQPLGLLRRYEGRARSRLLSRGYTTLRDVIRPMPEGPTI